MGEITRVDLDRLRRLVGDVSAAAAEVAELRCAELDPDALPGSAVRAGAAPGPILEQIHDVVARLRDWVMAARISADAFERADTANGERFRPR